MSLKKIGYRLIQFIFILIGIDVALFVFIPQQWVYQSMSSTLDKPVKADVIIALFDGVGENYYLNRESLRRVDYASTLFKEGYAPNIMFSGGGRSSQNLYGSNLMSNVAQELGLSPDQIYLETKSNDSISNWEESYKIIKKHQWQSVLIVSSLFHLKRVRHLINPHGINVYYTPVPFDNCNPPLTNFGYWSSAHYNLGSYVLYCLLPSSTYRNIINKLRH